MHYSEHNGVGFYYNGDYSGDVQVQSYGSEDKISVPFENLALTVLDGERGDWTDDEIDAIHAFVGSFIIKEEVARLERMDPYDIQYNDELKGLLEAYLANPEGYRYD